MRTLKDKLMPEYLLDPEVFAEAINQANKITDDLLQTYSNIWQYCSESFQVDLCLLPSRP
ncbi:MAG TPA: hypothetical protein EYQ43_11125 [Methyloprofundus sp.]|nr:hypothetical protein [Methyloprofundus sp.]